MPGWTDWCHRYLFSKLSLCGERASSEEQRHVGGKHRSGHTTFQRTEICGRKQLKDFGSNIGNPVQTVFTSPKIGVSQQCVVHQLKCDLCDTDYIGYTSDHLHISELKNIEPLRMPLVHMWKVALELLLKQFSLLEKCQGKLDCLIREMLFIRERQPTLNTQSDWIRLKVFV